MLHVMEFKCSTPILVLSCLFTVSCLLHQPQSGCCPTFAVTPELSEPALTNQVVFIQGHLGLFTHLFPQSSNRLHCKQTAARLQRLRSVWTFGTFAFPGPAVSSDVFIFMFWHIAKWVTCSSLKVFVQNTMSNSNSDAWLANVTN